VSVFALLVNPECDARSCLKVWLLTMTLLVEKKLKRGPKGRKSAAAPRRKCMKKGKGCAFRARARFHRCSKALHEPSAAERKSKELARWQGKGIAALPLVFVVPLP
jgi:hypothetical protein